MEIFNVVSDRHTQFNNRRPGLTLEKFGLHSSPERFDHGIVEAIIDCPLADFESVVTHVAGEIPGRKLSRFNRSLQQWLIELTVVVR